MPESLKQLKDKLDAKRAELRQVFKQAKTQTDDGETVFDFEKCDAPWLGAETIALTGTAKSMRIVELVNEKSAELDDLHDQATALEQAELAAKALEQHDRTPVARPGSPNPAETKHEKPQSFGEMVTSHDVYKSWMRGEGRNQKIELDIGMRDLKSLEHKATFETSAGWPPESTRTGVVVPGVTRPLQITDIMPTGTTGQAAVVYMEETLRTHAAAETAEGGAYPESSFELEEKSVTVRKIADSVPVTDEQLEDVAMVGSYLEGRLNFGIQQRADTQILAGDGVAPNLLGILNTPGIQTRANAGEPVPDTIYLCMKDIRVTGRAMPTHTVMHPDDWAPIRLLRTADGIYIWGSPSEQGPERIWGLPVIQNEVLTVGTALVGSFMLAWITWFERRGIVVERGFVGTNFTDGIQTIRASGRYANVVYRPAAFCTGTGL